MGREFKRQDNIGLTRGRHHESAVSNQKSNASADCNLWDHKHRVTGTATSPFLFFFGVFITKTHHNTGDVRANVSLSNQNAIELLALTSPLKYGPNFLIRI